MNQTAETPRSERAVNPSEPLLLRGARWLTFGSAVAILFSIAVSQTLLALALVALLLAGARLRLPPIKLPLGLFLLGTVISWLFSGELAAGIPQIRKFYVFLELLVVTSTLRDVVLLRRLVLSWAGLGGLIAVRGFVQFAARFREAQELGRNFYDYYAPGERITGFMSHWMTFSGQEMVALIMLGAFLFFAPGSGKRGWVWLLCAGLMALALLLGFTRSIWLGTAAAAVYLLWFYRRWLVVLAPAAAILVFLLSPGPVRERFTSMTNPKQGVDSNAFRLVTWETGLRIIQRHPVLGVGPEGIKYHFKDYVPAGTVLPDGWYGHLHNIYLQYAAERGIATMLVMLWLLARILLDFGRGLRALPPGRSNSRFLLHGAIAVVLAIMVEGFFEVNLGDTEVLTMFLTAVACGYLALEEEVVAA
jgi:putative inorganic carbon (hco3(-)) transporter